MQIFFTKQVPILLSADWKHQYALYSEQCEAMFESNKSEL